MITGGRGGGAGGGTATRPGRIRPPRRIGRPIAGQSSDAADFESCWETLSEALRDIHNKNCSALSFEQLYRAAYKIVLKKKGEDLYDRVRQFEEQYFADHVIPKIEQLVTANYISVAMPASSTLSVHERRQKGDAFLRGIRDAWDDHNTSMNMMADILMYLDRGYTQDSRKASIYTTTIGLFRDNILLSYLNNAKHRIFDMLSAVILDHVNMEREGDVVDRVLIRSCISMLDSLYESDEELDAEKLYLTMFEPRFLASERQYYTAECERLLRESDACNWLRHTQRRILEEIERCETMIHYETKEKSIRVVEDELISAHLEEFLTQEGSGVKWMIDNDKFEELSILFTLISRVDPKKTSLRTILSARVVELGLEIETALKNTDFSVPAGPHPNADDAAGVVDGAEKAKAQGPQPLTASAQQTAAAIKWVEDVLRLKDKFDNLTSRCFNSDLIILTALTKSFSDFINLFARCSEYVSLFIDDNLKRGIRGKTEAEVEQVLEKAITLIRYIQDRDLFERYYQKHLAKRLLHSKSESHDVEKQMISRMKQELGNQFTTKFEGMFRDMDTSSDLTTKYRDHIRGLGDASHKTIDLSVSILSTNSWPPEILRGGNATGEATSYHYPDDIKRLQDSLTKFYLNDHNGRKLTWIGTAGSADIKCTFPPIPGGKGPLTKERRYELNVSTSGMVVLLLFNKLDVDESLTLEEIQAKTNIPPPELVRTLSGLTLIPKSRVLLKEPQTKKISPGDKFMFNPSFVSKAIKIKVPIMSATSRVEDDSERKSTESRNNQTRAHVVDAAIVRIMKSRKELPHSQLITEVISQLVGQFKPEVGLVKKRIEDLIVREYLERAEDIDVPTYRYLA